MIVLTRLNGREFVVNAELIRTIEENPDTLVTLTTGDKLVVRERMSEVVRRSIEYGRHLRRWSPVEPSGPWSSGEGARNGGADVEAGVSKRGVDRGPSGG